VTKMKREMQMAASEASQLLQAERREKEAAKNSAELTNKSLEAEKRLVTAVRAEAAAATEQMQAERAAKFIADAEAKAVAEQLQRMEELIEKERTVARKVFVGNAPSFKMLPFLGMVHAHAFACHS
jgi:hypothetical protein